MKYLKFSKKIYIPVISLCTLFALEFYAVNELPEQYFSSVRGILAVLSKLFETKNGTETVLLLFFCVLFYYWFDSHFQIKHRDAGFIAALIAAVEIIGKNFQFMGRMFSASVSLWFSIAQLIVCFAGLYFLWIRLYELIRIFFVKVTEKNETLVPVFLKWFFNKNTFLHIALGLLFCWMPYYIAFYPGILQIDTKVALESYYGVTPWTTRYPPLGVLIMGRIMDIGKMCGNEKIGCTIYVILQILFMVVSFSVLFILLKKWNAPYWVRTITFLFTALFPFFPAYAVMEIKDTFYYIAWLWLLYTVILLLDYEKTYPKHLSKRIILSLIFSAVFVCLLRNEGKYIILLECIFFMFRIKRIGYRSAIFSCCLLGAMVFSLAVENLICRRFEISDYGLQDILSVPAQQTGRYMRDYYREIDNREWRLLAVVFSDERSLGDRYVPEISDPVKSSLLIEDSEDLKNYMEIWFQQFLKHPLCYLEAFIHQMYGYVYIDKPEFYGNVFSISKWNHISYGDMTYVPRTSIVKLLEDCYVLCCSLPVLKIINRPAFYAWFLFFIFSFIKKENRKIFLPVFGLPLGNFFVCCVSPVNAAMRYGLPVILSTVVIFPYVLSKQNKGLVL